MSSPRREDPDDRPEAGPEEGPAAGLLTDPARLAAVRASGLVGAVDDFDRYPRLARAAVAAPVVLFSVLDAARQHFPAQMGLGAPWATERSTPLTHSYCRFVVETDDVFIVDDSGSDRRVTDHPANRALGVAAYAGVPVHDRNGQVLGAFCAIDHQPRAWTENELTVLRDLADALEGELALRATSRELTHRLELEQEELRFELRLADVAAATNLVDGIHAVADAVVTHGPLAVGATVISLALVGDEKVDLHHSPSPIRAAADRRETTAIDRDLPVVAAALDGRPVILPDPEALADWPLAADSVADLGLRSLVCLPVADPAAGQRAAIAVGWADPLPGGDVPPAVRRLVAVTTHALARAVRFDRERAQARTLERVVIPSALPTVAGVTVVGSYLAPSTRQRVGGDLYDAVTRDDGAVGVVIADAVGHDLEATRAAARVRHAVGMLTVEQIEPARLLQSVNSYLMQSSRSRLVTCAYLVLDPLNGEMTMANAGHPQPRLIRDGRVSALGPSGDPLLGLAAHTYRQERAVLQAGDVVVGFTDGLIERRSTPIADGEMWLDQLLTELAGQPPDAIGRALLDQVTTTEREDDTALIVVGFDGRAIPDSAVVVLEWPADQVKLSEARAALRDWLDGHGRDALTADVSLVVTELLTNARTASVPGTRVRLQARFDRGDCVVRVENAGRVFDAHRAMPGPTSTRGRGLALVGGMARQLQVRVTGERVAVEARLADPTALPDPASNGDHGPVVLPGEVGAAPVPPVIDRA